LVFNCGAGLAASASLAWMNCAQSRLIVSLLTTWFRLAPHWMHPWRHWRNALGESAAAVFLYCRCHRRRRSEPHEPVPGLPPGSPIRQAQHQVVAASGTGLHCAHAPGSRRSTFRRGRSPPGSRALWWEILDSLSADEIEAPPERGFFLGRRIARMRLYCGYRLFQISIINTQSKSITPEPNSLRLTRPDRRTEPAAFLNFLSP